MLFAYYGLKLEFVVINNYKNEICKYCIGKSSCRISCSS